MDFKIREKEDHIKKIDCKDNDNTETKIERSNEVQGDKPKRIENSVCRAKLASRT